MTLALSTCGLTMGYHIAYGLDHIVTHHLARKFDARSYTIIPVGYKFVREPSEIITQLLGLFSWVTVIVVAATVSSQRHLSLALVFAPLGTLTRWWLSRFNTRIAGFPLGTFIANIFATLVLAIVILLTSGQVSSSAGCNVLQAIVDGYCGEAYISLSCKLRSLAVAHIISNIYISTGCLSTISTFAVSGMENP